MGLEKTSTEKKFSRNQQYENELLPGSQSNSQNKLEIQGKLTFKTNAGFAKGQPARHQLIC